jgi:hypothetical protein
MTVKFFNGRKLVYEVVSSGINYAVSLINSTDIEWSRYKIV